MQAAPVTSCTELLLLWEKVAARESSDRKQQSPVQVVSVLVLGYLPCINPAVSMVDPRGKRSTGDGVSRKGSAERG